MNETSLIEATKRGDIDAVDAALAAGAPIDARDSTGATALWYAAWLGYPSVMERLLAGGANPDGHDPVAIDRHAGDGQVVSIWIGLPDTARTGPEGRGSLLHVAAGRAQVAVAEILLARGEDPGARDRFGSTPLHIAAFKGCVPLIELLLARGADPNAEDRVGHAPLDTASLDLAAIRALLAGGASPDGGNKEPWPSKSYAWSTLTTAAAAGRVDVINALLDAGAHIDRHREALPLAAKHGMAQAVRRLLAAGAPLDATTEWRGRERPPLEAACMYASRPCAELLLEPCRHELPLALSAAVALSSDDHPLPPNDRKAARVELVGWLLDQGARPEEALHAAAGVEDPTYIDMLLHAGADADARGERGRTPLHCAAEWGRHAVARRLVARGVDLEARDDEGLRAYEIARQSYRALGIEDARVVMSILSDAGAGAVVAAAAAAPAAPVGPRIGARVTHPKFGEGVIAGIEKAGDDQKLAIDFASSGRKVLLARFVKLLG